ncbi:MAG: FAD-dependent oxidoreductase [Gammaproteobacteria bacterium]
MSISNQTLEEHATLQATKLSLIQQQTPAVVVVGSGPVGMQFVNELARRTTQWPVVIYGAEPHQPYDRVRLSSYLAGDVTRTALSIELEFNPDATIEQRLNCPVVHIDREAQTVTDAAGRVQKYVHLVLAVGSKPFVPAIVNSDVPGVYTFRSLAEADQLSARMTRTQRTVVLGGGLLGLETARAMQRYNTQITIVEHNKWLMLQQLDEEGGQELKEYIEGLGMEVVLGNSVVAVIGEQRVEGVKLRDGTKIDCDTFVIATGIRPNVELALQSGLAFQKGIRVNDLLQTSDENIYAIGECAEHKQTVYGLVKPGFEMAAVLAEKLAGGYAHYMGSLDSTHLKVMDRKVFSAGRCGSYDEESALVNEYTYRSRQNGVYRKIRLYRNRIIGAIAIGGWHEAALMQEAISSQRRIMWWHLLRFKMYGYVWGDEAATEVLAWPSGAVICNCTGVTRGKLTSVLEQGCMTAECLSNQTRAGTVCGSCKPLLAEMVGETAAVEPVRSWRSLLAMSVTSFVMVMLFMLIWRIPYAESVQVTFRWDELWRNELFKQISGFSMLGLMLLGLLISLRKRSKKQLPGEFSQWRMVHVVLGVSALVVLISHTGFRLGSELNLILMLNFLLLTVAGANASKVVANEHRMVATLAKSRRNKWNWIHILLFWPLPVILGFHVLKTYYY